MSEKAEVIQEIVITRSFMKGTDAIIKRIVEVGLVQGNSNVMIALPGVATTQGSIIQTDAHVKKETQRSGFGRIIAVPINLVEGDLPFKVGDFVFFVYADNIPMGPAALKAVLKMPVPKNGIHNVSDAQCTAVVPQEAIDVQPDMVLRYSLRYKYDGADVVKVYAQADRAEAEKAKLAEDFRASQIYLVPTMISEDEAVEI